MAKKSKRKEHTLVIKPPVRSPSSQFDHSVLLGVLDRLRRDEEQEKNAS